MTSVVDAATRAANTALPAWLNENLPAWFNAKPATTEAIYKGITGLGKLAYIVAASFFASADTLGVTDYLAYAEHYHWWILIVTTIFPAISAKTAFTKAKGP